MLKNEREIDAQNNMRVNHHNAIIMQDKQEVGRINRLRYKEDLDRQRQVRDAMLAYGNMSQAEKQMNKSDLKAYKNYESVNYNMVPGIQPNS
jgi:hypothetical protein